MEKKLIILGVAVAVLLGGYAIQMAVAGPAPNVPGEADPNNPNDVGVTGETPKQGVADMVDMIQARLDDAKKALASAENGEQSKAEAQAEANGQIAVAHELNGHLDQLCSQLQNDGSDADGCHVSFDFPSSSPSG